MEGNSLVKEVNEMTYVVYFSGVHGSGKTTIRTKVTQRLQKAGMSVYAFPEFSYIPDIPIGTPEFQLWYRTQLRIREELIQYLINTKYFDIVLVDRHPVDEKIYAKRIGGNKEIEYYLNVNSIHIFVKRPLPAIIESLKKRMELEDQAHRKEWNEDNEEYIDYIDTEFMNLYRDIIKGSNAKNMFILPNADLEIAVTKALEIIMRCIK